ncbi:PqqD family peptide modification chaperone [Brevibacillus laterosporus]|uniref:PqqD family peptide modification chaperone n=1 Tax=Brevibacillus laterosporus TaxID=1465 RepID=UPI003D1F529D
MQVAKIQELSNHETRLADGVELIYGINDQPLLYNPDIGNYVRISSLGIKVVGWLNKGCTIEQIIERLTIEYQKPHEEVRPVVNNFLEQLRQARMLNIEPIPENLIGRSLGYVRKRPVFRIPLLKTTKKITYPFSNLLGMFSTKILFMIGAIIFLLAVSIVALFLYKNSFLTTYGNVSWVIIISVIVIHLLLHEMTHATILQRFGINIRQAGIGLLYYILPIAYVDTTDAYRLRNKYERAAVALGGPVFDILGAAISTIICLWGNMWWSNQFQIIFKIQFAIFIINLNPLLPSDGFHAIESLMGELNMRRRALHYFFCKITFRSSPNYLANLPKTKKIQYSLYTLLSVGYFVLIVYFMILFYRRLVSG